MQRQASAAEKTSNKIGLFGGSFNPVHYGHLIVAEIVKDVCRLERIFFIPSHIHPFAEKKNISLSADHRLAMLKLALESNPDFEVSTYELDKTTTSYTVETLRAFKQIYPDKELYFLTGADAAAGIHKWKSVEEIFTLCQIIVVGRPGYLAEMKKNRYFSQMQFVETLLIEISSTMIRSAANDGRTIKYLLPAAVESYIHQQKLYRSSA